MSKKRPYNKEYADAYREKNREKLRASQSKFRAANRDRIRQEQKLRRDLNKKQKPELGYNPETHKKCSHCKEILEHVGFRIRTDNRRDPPIVYINNTCLKCEAEMQRKRSQRHRDSVEWTEKNRQNARKYYHKKKEVIKEREKRRRQTAEYKEMVKRYYRANRDKILQQHRVVCKKASDELRDWVVVCKIAQKQHKYLRPLVKENKELIELKRLQILSIRETKKKN